MGCEGRAEPPRARVTLGQRAGFWTFRLARAILRCVPPPLAYAAAGRLGAAYVRLSGRRQRLALRLLHHAYPDVLDDARLLRLARLGTGNFFKVVVDMVRAPSLVASGRFAELMDLEEYRAKVPPPPWIGVTPHLGNWECGAIGVASQIGVAHVTARRSKNPLIQRELVESRRAMGVHIHDRRGGIRGAARALAQGGALMQVTDQYQRLRGVRTEFFGEMTSTERAPAALAVRQSCPLIVAGIVRVGSGFRFKLRIDRIVHPPGSGDARADVQWLAEQMNRGFERLILEHPEQYLWIHNRYRGAPPRVAEPSPG